MAHLRAEEAVRQRPERLLVVAGGFEAMPGRGGGLPLEPVVIKAVTEKR